MKNRILLILLFFSLLSFAQQGTVNITWKDNAQFPLNEGNSVKIPQFDYSDMEYKDDSRELFFRERFHVSGKVNPASLQITNIIYESISSDLLGELSIDKIPLSINQKLESVHARNEWYAEISFSPIIKDGSGYKRIKSFSYSYNIGGGTFNFKDTQIITNSVLASGEWRRFYVEKSGVYRISKSFLQQIGVNVNVDPRKIKIYGNGGRMAPLSNSIAYPDDLAENAILFVGEEDGNFGDGDYILFYAEGVDNWNAESGTNNNLYANKAYYYVTSSGADGKRIGDVTQPTGPATVTVTSFDDYYFHEEDLVSIARLGRKWHGEQFNVNNSQDFEFFVPDIDLSSPVTINVNAAAASVTSTSMGVKANGQNVGTVNFGTSGGSNVARDGMNSNQGFVGAFTPAGGTITINLTYNNNGVPGSNAWLDYIVIKPKRFLKGNGKQFRFQYDAAGGDTGVLEYQLTNASGIGAVWDITDIYNVRKIANEGNQAQFSFKAQAGEVRKYITVVSSDYYSPLRDSQTAVANQNIKGTIFNNAQGQFQDIDYLIITPSYLNSEAERLANIHRTGSGLNVKVVNLENIYQEFSSGKQDIAAIRNLIKYVYYNASSVDKRVKYVCLFGDASFDYKNRIPNNTNIVPTFHAYGGSTSNYSTATTFVSDEFFVLMDADEGTLISGAESADIAVGRMLVTNVSDARPMVDKVAAYLHEESYGRWRNEYILVADDPDEQVSNFVPKMEEVYSMVVANKPFINVRKIYSDAYVQESSSGGYRYPQAKQQIIRSINYGALIVNYLGHGGEDGMAAERIFEKSDAQELNNENKYPLFITVTCELTRFDNPYRPTCGEYLYWNPKGGAIGLITTTRSIFVSDAFTFNSLLPEYLLSFDGSEYPSMAEAMRRAKVEHPVSGLRVISFIGDPALIVAIPRPKIVLTEINDVPVSGTPETLKALSYVKLEGQVTDEVGNLLSNYSGELAATVFDKPIDKQTLGNDGITNSDDEVIIDDFQVLGEAIFRGNATVAAGKFEFNFVVPRDIRIPVGNGRVSFYSKRNNLLEDQTGFDNDIKIGGINENAEEDVTGPTVKLYMNDESFISGGITNDSPIFLAFLEDEHGINTASGIGHDIVAILDGDETKPFVLNDYYETDVDNYMKGSLKFPFSDLEPGLHTITFKAWDVYNNLVTAEIQFVVVGNEEMRLEKVLNYPNPFVSYTEFWFTHNRPFEPLDVQVQIFTVSGKVVKTINQSVTTEGFLCRDIKWDGRDDFGDRIGKGVYVYKLTVRSASTGKKAEKYEKLVLL